MNRVYLTLCAVLLSLILPLGYLVYSGGQEIAELKQSNKSLTEAAERAASRAKLDRKVLVAKQAQVASKQRELDKAQEALSEALQRNKSWSDTDVPDDVQKALSGPSSPAPDGL